MNRLSLLAMLSLAGLTPIAPGLLLAADEVDITGTYSCVGKNPGGASYSGTVVISKKGDTYRLLWTIGRSETHRGTGIREGHVLSVCFVTPDSVGVVSYKIEEADQDAKLVGRWTVVGQDKMFAETLSKRKLSERKGIVGPPQKPVLKELLPGLPSLESLPEEPKPQKSTAHRPSRQWTVPSATDT